MTEIGKDIQRAARHLASHTLVAIPTETVYGLAANALHTPAVEAIYDAKQRPRHNPLILHIGHPDQLETYAQDIPDIARALARRFWPGPLTLLLPRRHTVPDILTAGLPEVAIRVPDHPMTLELLATIDFPLAAPSANPFGYISPTTPEHVMAQLGGKIAYILDGGPCTQGIESTIVGFDGGQPIIYRHGAIPAQAIQEVVGELSIRTKKTDTPLAPGMLPAHYAPRTPLILVETVPEALALHNHLRCALLAFNKPSPTIPAERQVVLSTHSDLPEAARKLYASLHYLDSLGLDLIIAERVPDTGIGQAINDRLTRAAYDTQNKTEHGL